MEERSTLPTEFGHTRLSSGVREKRRRAPPNGQAVGCSAGALRRPGDGAFGLRPENRHFGEVGAATCLLPENHRRRAVSGGPRQARRYRLCATCDMQERTAGRRSADLGKPALQIARNRRHAGKHWGEDSARWWRAAADSQPACEISHKRAEEGRGDVSKRRDARTTPPPGRLRPGLGAAGVGGSGRRSRGVPWTARRRTPGGSAEAREQRTNFSQEGTSEWLDT